MYDPSMRVLTVLELLQARERISAREIAERLEVSVRTVQRYIQRLQDLGVPVTATRGPGASYRISPGFRMPPVMLGAEEVFAVRLGLEALQSVGLSGIATATVAVLAKLKRLTPVAIEERAEAVVAALGIEAPSDLIAADVETLIELAVAVDQHRCVEIDYRDRSEHATTRVIEPYQLIQLEGRWFTVAHCRLRGGPRSFRIDRMERVELLDVTFVSPDDFDPRAFLLRSLALQQAPWTVAIRLEMPRPDVERRFPRGFAVLEDQIDGSTLMRTTTTDLEHVAMRVLLLGCELKILEPPELADAFRSVAVRALSLAAAVQAASPSS